MAPEERSRLPKPPYIGAKLHVPRRVPDRSADSLPVAPAPAPICLPRILAHTEQREPPSRKEKMRRSTCRPRLAPHYLVMSPYQLRRTCLQPCQDWQAKVLCRTEIDDDFGLR